VVPGPGYEPDLGETMPLPQHVGPRRPNRGACLVACLVDHLIRTTMHGMRKSLICVFRSGSCRHQLTSDSVPRYGRPSRPSPRMDWTRPKKRHPSHHPSRSRDHQTSPSPDCRPNPQQRSDLRRHRADAVRARRGGVPTRLGAPTRPDVPIRRGVLPRPAGSPSGCRRVLLSARGRCRHWRGRAERAKRPSSRPLYRRTRRA